MPVFTPNDVLAFLWRDISLLLASGSPTATVYLEPSERTEVDFESTSEIILSMISESPMLPGSDCGYHGMWYGTKDIFVRATILSRDRYTAQSVWARLEDFLHHGVFWYTLLTPSGEHPPLFYVTLDNVSTYPTDSENYGLLVHFHILTRRTFPPPP